MRRMHWYHLGLMMLLASRPSLALDLHWASGATDLTFTEARLCTLVVEPGPGEATLPDEWRLLWVAVNLPSLSITPDTTFETSMTQVVEVLSPRLAEASAGVTTCVFQRPASSAMIAARYVLALPAGAAGKFVVYAPLEGPATLTRSPVATFNGGVASDFPPIVMSARGDHTTTRFAVSGVGQGLGGATSARLVAADTSWRVPLTIVATSDSTLSADAEIPAKSGGWSMPRTARVG